MPRIQRGELLEIIVSEGTPRAEAKEPAGTRSQRIEYWESTGRELRKVAFIHRYLRPDGTLGASGMPDPKRVFYNGEIFAAHVEPPPPPSS